MAITHFKITELPSSVYAEGYINGIALQEEVLYPIADESGVEFFRNAELADYPVSLGFKYKTYDDVNDIFSNEATVFLRWRTTNVSLPPASTNVALTTPKNDEINILDEISINEAVEYIKIIKIEGVPNLTLNGADVLEGQVILVQDLKDTKFNTNAHGGGHPYSKIDYIVGKGFDEENMTVYSININVDSLAEIGLQSPETISNQIKIFDVGGVPTSYNVKNQVNTLKITDGYIMSSAKIEISIDCDYLSLNPWNSVIVNYGGQQFEYFSNFDYQEEIFLDMNGSNSMTVISNIVEDVSVAKTGTVTVKILSINNDTSIISPTNFEYEIVTNLP